MKRTIEAQIGGRVFSFEEDAYAHILDYMKAAEKKLLGDDDKDEIIRDLEYAISTRLLNRDHATEAVVLTEAKALIGSMGNVETFDDETPKTKKSLLGLLGDLPARDSRSAIIGGVCSGIAASKNGDASYTFWLRVAVIILTLITGGYFALFYISLWLFMPKDPLQSKNASATNIIDQARLKRGEAKNDFEKFSRSFERVMKSLVRIVVVVTRIAVGSIASLLLAGTIFGMFAGLIWLSNSATTQDLRVTSVYVHVISVALALAIPLTALVAYTTKAKIKVKVTFVSVLTIIVPWFIAVISSFVLIGVNQTKYTDYIKKVKPNNAFVSTVTINDKVVIRCVSLANCYDHPVAYPTYRCQTSFLTVSEEGREYLMGGNTGTWLRYKEDMMPPVTEDIFCAKVNEIQAKNGGVAIIADTPLNTPILMRSGNNEKLYPVWELTYFIRHSAVQPQ